MQYQALWLKYAEEMDVASIAQVLRKTQTHVKVLLFRARQALGRELSSARRPGLSSTGVVGRLAPDVGTKTTSLRERGMGLKVGGIIGGPGLVSSAPYGARKGPA